MSVVESCRKIEYDAFFMMIFIPVSNFSDQPLELDNQFNSSIARPDYLSTEIHFVKYEVTI